jgi:hypothetical protein
MPLRDATPNTKPWPTAVQVTLAIVAGGRCSLKNVVGKWVIILGTGVAGMSAAHELIERGFEVVVYERNTIAGGKARSIDVVGSGKEGRKDLPGEHGFRFFSRFYKHITRYCGCRGSGHQHHLSCPVLHVDRLSPPSSCQLVRMIALRLAISPANVAKSDRAQARVRPATIRKLPELIFFD